MNEWVGTYAVIANLQPGFATQIGYDQMRSLCRTNQTWPDSERHMSSEEMNAEIRTWPMFMDYSVSFDPYHDRWTVSRPKEPHHEPLRIPIREHL